jgi:DNA end-binding protein Ku
VYALLRETMKKAGCVAVATVIIQTRQHLAALIPDERMLLLNTLRFADEIRDAADLHFPDAGAAAAGVKPGEIAMAQKLIDSMRGEWNPAAYHDTYHEDIMARVKEKIKAGQTSEVPEPEKEGPPRRSAEVIDLMALLKNSIPGAKKGTPQAREKEPAPAAKSRAKTAPRGAIARKPATPQRKRAA